MFYEGKREKKFFFKSQFDLKPTQFAHWSIGGVYTNKKDDRKRGMRRKRDGGSMMRSSSRSGSLGSDGVVCVQCELTGWLKGFGSDGRMCRWAIMAWSRSLSFANCEGQREQIWAPETTKFGTGVMIWYETISTRTQNSNAGRKTNMGRSRLFPRDVLHAYTRRHLLRCLTVVNAL